MKITLAAIVPRRNRSKADAFESLLTDYTKRAARYIATDWQLLDSEPEFLAWLSSQPGRVTPYAIFLDSRGKQFSSEEIATMIGNLRDQGTQRLVMAIGPADGWSDQARDQAGMVLSFGRITLPHQLARVVLSEQVYRGLSILAGHPYHSGH